MRAITVDVEIAFQLCAVVANNMANVVLPDPWEPIINMRGLCAIELHAAADRTSSGVLF